MHAFTNPNGGNDYLYHCDITATTTTTTTNTSTTTTAAAAAATTTTTVTSPTNIGSMEKVHHVFDYNSSPTKEEKVQEEYSARQEGGEDKEARIGRV